jgi:predicted RNA-binding protein with PUA-like domain
MAKPAVRTWLMKSEPSVFSFQDLWKAKGRKTLWDGVRNYRARNFMRDDMKVGDRVLYYHSNADPAGVAGVAEVCREAYPDPTQFDPKSKYFDAKSDPAEPRWVVVDLRAVRALPAFVSLADLKENPRLTSMGVVQRGNRLSVQPVTDAEWREVLRMGGL